MSKLRTAGMFVFGVVFTLTFLPAIWLAYWYLWALLTGHL